MGRHGCAPAVRHQDSNLIRKLVAVVFGALGLTAISFPSHANDIPHSPMHIGVRCQDDFQNNYDATIDAYSMCGNFINTIRRTDWIDFYFNLHGANVAFSSGNPVRNLQSMRRGR